MPFDGTTFTVHNPVAEHLTLAKDYILEHGWCQHMLKDPIDHVCLVGALVFVRGTWTEAAGNARAALVQNLKEQGYSASHGDSYSLPRWNNEKDRTVEEVVQLINDTIAQELNNAA